MEGNVCCCNSDFDGPDVLTERIVRARKSYKCYECYEIIKPGDTYEYTKGLWDGTCSTFKTCRLCARIRDSLFECGFTYGALDELLQEYYGVSLIE